MELTPHQQADLIKAYQRQLPSVQNATDREAWCGTCARYQGPPPSPPHCALTRQPPRFLGSCADYQPRADRIVERLKEGPRALADAPAVPTATSRPPGSLAKGCLQAYVAFLLLPSLFGCVSLFTHFLENPHGQNALILLLSVASLVGLFLLLRARRQGLYLFALGTLGSLLFLYLPSGPIGTVSPGLPLLALVPALPLLLLLIPSWKHLQ